MGSYLSGSAAPPPTGMAGLMTALSLNERHDLGDRARLVLAEHVPGLDGWCAGCLAVGLFYFPPCPVVSGLLLACGEPGAGWWLTGRSA